MNKLILFLLLVVPGSAVAITSVGRGVNDYMALVSIHKRFQELATQGASDRELFVIAYRENTHRLNLAFDATWVILGGTLTGFGIQEITEVDK